jgi:hypothetical protein
MWRTQKNHALPVQEPEVQCDTNKDVSSSVKPMLTLVIFQRKSAVNIQVTGSVGKRPLNGVARSSPGQKSLRLYKGERNSEHFGVKKS